MIYRSIIVHMLVLIGNGHATKINLGTFTGKGNLCRITGCPVVKCHPIEQYIAIRSLLHIQIAETHCAGMGLFQFVKIKNRIFFRKHFNDLRCQKVHIIHGMITNQQTSLSSLFKDNQHTSVYHEIDICTKYINQLDGFINNHILRNIHQYSVLSKSCIKGRYCILRSICQLTIILFYKFRMLLSHFSQTAENNSLR